MNSIRISNETERDTQKMGFFAQQKNFNGLNFTIGFRMTENPPFFLTLVSQYNMHNTNTPLNHLKCVHFAMDFLQLNFIVFFSVY